MKIGRTSLIVAPCLLIAVAASILAQAARTPAQIAAAANAKKSGRIGNAASFETIEAANERAVREGGAAPPSMEGYPRGTTYVYRSSNMYGTYSYSRLNTCLVIFADRKYEDLAGAKAFVDSTGLIDIVEKAKGSFILVGPIAQKWGQLDLDAYQKLQTALFWEARDNYGAFGLLYLIGQGSGATFINSYIARTKSNIGRAAGILTVGGEMAVAQQGIGGSGAVGAVVPAYLVNAQDAVIRAYKNANGVAAEGKPVGSATVFMNPKRPAQKVVTEQSNANLKSIIATAYETLLRKSIRIPISPAMNYWLDSDLFSLAVRNSPEELGITMIAHEDGEKLPGTEIVRWYEYAPSSVLKDPKQKVPFILVLHGAGDDPRALVEQCGWLDLAAKEKIIMIAPDHQNITDRDLSASSQADAASEKMDQIDLLVQYALKKYPNIDPARIYATGYSWGGKATTLMGVFFPDRFAAIAPMGFLLVPNDNVKDYSESVDRVKDKYDLPAFVLMDGCDGLHVRRYGLISELNFDQGINLLAAINGLAVIDPAALDFEKYPFWGFEIKDKSTVRLPDTYAQLGSLYNHANIPMMKFANVEGLNHALYQGYAAPAWDYMKQFSRDPTTKELSYKPNAK